MTEPYEGPERRDGEASRNTEVMLLRTVSESLEAQISNLTRALNETSQIQKRQIELEERQQHTEEEAKSAKAEAAKLAEMVVPREEHERNAKLLADQERARRRGVLVRIYVAAIIAVVVMGGLALGNGIGFYGLHREHDDFVALRTAAYDNCLARNRANAANALLYGTLAELIGQGRSTPSSREAVKALRLAQHTIPSSENCVKIRQAGQ